VGINQLASPKVIAHRGASGYRPENTLEAFQLGIDQGADGIEFDVVATKDKELIIRHENKLSETTNISTIESLSHLFNTVEKDYLSEALTLSQIKMLRAKERIPEVRPGSAKFDEQFGIPTFAEVLDANFTQDKLIVAEIKQGSHLESLDEPIQELFAAVLAQHPAKGTLVVESFDYQILLDTKAQLESKNIKAQYFFLMEQDRSELDLDSFDGISVSLEMLFSDKDWVAYAHQHNLQCWAYTARVENAQTSVEEYFEHIIQKGVDGIFTDQPDLLRRVLDERGGSTYDY
jgi:glycerophosphoryl diester phosphodiesterase